MKPCDRKESFFTREGQSWLILTILCILASLLVPGIALASTASGAETRVWAFDLQDQVRVGVERSLTLEPHPGCEPTYDQLASDSLLAAKEATRSLSERIADFQKDPQDWERTAASAEQATGRAAKGGVSIESTCTNTLEGADSGPSVSATPSVLNQETALAPELSSIDWNARGAETSRTEPAGTWTRTWDALGRLRTSQHHSAAGPVTLTWRWDGLDRLVERNDAERAPLRGSWKGGAE